MTTLATCQRCGRATSPGDLFCAACGADVSGQQKGDDATALTARANKTLMQQNELLERLRSATLGDYEVLAELGRGGMASVFLAHDLQLDRKVAIKVMLPSLLEGEGMIDRFKLEARTAAQLSHPHIIPIFAVRDTEQMLFFVMKFIEGRALDTILREVGPLPVPMAQTILAKVGEALGYAHRRGVVHRDIKPANLMVDVEGEPMVTDFGIAKVAEKSGLTMTGMTIGTPTYMSPEQASAGAITGASDQYSLGVVAYEMLAGRVPFQGDTMVSLLYQHCHEAPPPFRDQRPEVPEALHDAVMRMLAKRPEDRFPNLEAAVEQIGRVALAYDDPVRVQLVEYARKGSNRTILASVRTPRSAIPTRTRKSGPQPTAANSAASAPTVASVTGGSATVAAPAPKQTGLFIGVGVAVLVGVAALWRPWEKPPAPAVSPVAAAGVASVVLTPSAATVTVDGAQQLVAAVSDSAGRPLGMSVIWSSADPQVATVSPSGLVTGHAPGSVTVRAVAGAVEATAQVTVSRATAAAPPPAEPAAARTPTVAAAPNAVPASVRIEGAPPSLGVGGTASLGATLLDNRGGAIAGKPVQWVSADPSKASVTQAGHVTAIAPGNATIIARSAGIEGRVAIEVVAARPATAEPAPAPARPAAEVAKTPDPVATPKPATPAPAAPAPAPAAAAVDPRVAIEEAVLAYGRALESRRINEVRRVYPGMQPEQEQQLTQTMNALEDLKVTLKITNIDLRGDDRAVAAVSGVYDFFSRDNRRRERIPVTLQATLEKSGDNWRLQQMRSAK